ncbi:MAG: hypothetical protein ACRENE_27930 [Polyangiaceae bacterium]
MVAPLGACLAGMTSCSAPAKGSLMLAVSTDMQAPKDVDLLSVFVTSDSAVKLDYLGRVAPAGSLTLPATLAIVQPDNPDAQLNIRVTFFKGQTARVTRDIVTTVPRNRTALLRVSLGYLDDGDVTGTLPAQYLPGPTAGGASVPDGDTNYSPIDEPGAVLSTTCPFGSSETSIDGECVDNAVDSSKLPDYSDDAVFGSGGAKASVPVDCFDVATCFGTATPVVGLDRSQCTLPLPAGANAASFNLALQTSATGACVATGTCYVPLVSDATAGWSVSGGTVKLLPGVCKKMNATGAQLVQAVACPTRTLSDPVCEGS